MKLYIRDRRELLAAAVLGSIACGIIVMSSGYDRGTAVSMGPGYLPLILGIILAVLALLVAASAVSLNPKTSSKEAADDTFGLHSLWPLLVVAGAFVAFAFLLKAAGLALTCFAVLSAAGIASGLLRPTEALITALALSSAAVILFVYLLDLQIQTWPW